MHINMALKPVLMFMLVVPESIQCAKKTAFHYALPVMCLKKL